MLLRSICIRARSLSRVWLFKTSWTVACLAPLSVGFSRREYWSGLPCLSPEVHLYWCKWQDYICFYGWIKFYCMNISQFLYPFTYRWALRFSPYLQFSSVAQSCPTFCSLMNCSTPGLPVHHQLPEFTQTHVYRVGDAIQPSHPLSSPSPPAFNPSQHQGLFQWVNSLHDVAKVLELQHQSFQWTPRTDIL